MFCGETSDGRVCEMNHGLATKGIRFGFSEMLPPGDLRLTFRRNICRVYGAEMFLLYEIFAFRNF